MKSEIEKDLEKVYKKLSKEKEPFIIVTKNITTVGGKEIEIMNMITELVEGLKERGFSERLIKGAVKTGLMNEKDVKKWSKEFMNCDSFEEAMNKIADFLGEEKRW